MKQLHIKCHNGKEIVLVDTIGRENYYEVLGWYMYKGLKLKPVGFLKDITEEQAKEWFTDSDSDAIQINIKYLHDIIRSHGWHLWENPYKNPLMNAADPSLIEEAEERTMFNPFIFEKI